MPGEPEDAAMAFLPRLDPATLCEAFERLFDVLAWSRTASRDGCDALHDACRQLGRSPSVREYKALRHKHPEAIASHRDVGHCD